MHVILVYIGRGRGFPPLPREETLMFLLLLPPSSICGLKGKRGRQGGGTLLGFLLCRYLFGLVSEERKGGGGKTHQQEEGRERKEEGGKTCSIAAEERAEDGVVSSFPRFFAPNAREFVCVQSFFSTPRFFSRLCGETMILPSDTSVSSSAAPRPTFRSLRSR